MQCQLRLQSVGHTRAAVPPKSTYPVRIINLLHRAKYIKNCPGSLTETYFNEFFKIIIHMLTCLDAFISDQLYARALLKIVLELFVVSNCSENIIRICYLV